MRIMTWNCCRRSYESAMAAVAPLDADVVFLQEVGKPATPERNIAWSGIVATQGVLVGVPSRHLSLKDAACEAAECVPVWVLGRVPFLALNIWAQRSPSYVRHVNVTLDHFHDVLRSGQCVIAGDFNTEGEPGSDLKTHHARLVDRLRTEFGVVSAYHHRHGVEHGAEEHATYFHQRNIDNPWHIDFCFLPHAWAEKIRAVEVLDGEPWIGLSDHRPLVVDVDL